MERYIYSLSPVIDKDAKVLILGSIPGNKSLETNQYYGNPRNHFWKIIFSVYEESGIEDYEKKLSFLKEHEIALWDVIYSCQRKGSLDSNIRVEVPNKLTELIHEHRQLKLVIFNGTKAYNTFKKHFDMKMFTGVDFKKMPSTSPIPGRFNKTIEGKIEDWKIIKEYS
ncbi:DNA-deoxyinosine glycosylase [Halobacillus shinanisalinarum]|uniref:DNA-deoxyinosine glycosylase n=1 Tax=Halobacillus shinanisalinarum TaxID=2932258 RepID=A0ABY4H0D7_9BACI|nr:DNA-deoxyinosine glycosylase [Halobacillus shinanisalinarum]UOQ93898.1 DNA-deoxyinosine glycosylase [Halobacillus shinanisalinarum]